MQPLRAPGCSFPTDQSVHTDRGLGIPGPVCVVASPGPVAYDAAITSPRLRGFRWSLHILGPGARHPPAPASIAGELAGYKPSTGGGASSHCHLPRGLRGSCDLTPSVSYAARPGTDLPARVWSRSPTHPRNCTSQALAPHQRGLYTVLRAPGPIKVGFPYLLEDCLPGGSSLLSDARGWPKTAAAVVAAPERAAYDAAIASPRWPNPCRLFRAHILAGGSVSPLPAWADLSKKISN